MALSPAQDRGDNPDRGKRAPPLAQEHSARRGRACALPRGGRRSDLFRWWRCRLLQEAAEPSLAAPDSAPNEICPPLVAPAWPRRERARGSVARSPIDAIQACAAHPSLIARLLSDTPRTAAHCDRRRTLPRVVSLSNHIGLDGAPHRPSTSSGRGLRMRPVRRTSSPSRRRAIGAAVEGRGSTQASPCVRRPHRRARKRTRRRAVSRGGTPLLHPITLCVILAS